MRAERHAALPPSLAEHRDQAIVEVETDKISNAVECADPGLLRRIVAQSGELLPVKALLSPVRFNAPAPLLAKLPLPEIALAKLASVACWISSAALLTIAPVPKLAAVPTSVPAEITVPPA